MILPTFGPNSDLQRAIHEAYPEIPWREPTRCRHERVRGECRDCNRELRTLHRRQQR